MGSFFSTSAPSYSASSIYQTPTALSVSTAADTDTTDDAPSSTDTEESVKDSIRRASRAGNGTILSSYRGLLTDTNSLSPKRKTLLGE